MNIKKQGQGKIFLINIQRKVKLDTDYLSAVFSHLEKKTLDSFESVNIVLVSDRYIKCINRRFLNKSLPTDVIAFKYDSILEIVISVETAKRQAEEACHTLEKEILFLVIHGILHFSGYNDDTQENQNRMLKMQNKIFNEILKECDGKTAGCS